MPPRWSTSRWACSANPRAEQLLARPKRTETPQSATHARGRPHERRRPRKRPCLRTGPAPLRHACTSCRLSPACARPEASCFLAGAPAHASATRCSTSSRSARASTFPRRATCRCRMITGYRMDCALSRCAAPRLPRPSTSLLVPARRNEDFSLVDPSAYSSCG